MTHMKRVFLTLKLITEVLIYEGNNNYEIAALTKLPVRVGKDECVHEISRIKDQEDDIAASEFLAAKDDHTEEGVGEKTAEGEDGVELESVLLARKARKAEAPEDDSKAHF
ncbi:hypothetical protein PRIPAC_96947 [Pristionchus pacificus]|uniref:Uncharacterized protein n=1 Tax=Pristionchus pacificus TaxID=54126 RepID=A0A2A6CHA7_PRIPA|nr:hypothetical protein PRIPAC_96947 [Pristionchus pacificus]|eukprot:PDM77470.1 hypothetical protein PRIPAC_33200 [Pristionchus pacificus]